MKPNSRLILIAFPGIHKYTRCSPTSILNNRYFSECLDMILYFMHEKGLINFLEEHFSFIGFGIGANIALYYAQELSPS